MEPMNQICIAARALNFSMMMCEESHCVTALSQSSSLSKRWKVSVYFLEKHVLDQGEQQPIHSLSFKGFLSTNEKKKMYRSCHYSHLYLDFKVKSANFCIHMFAYHLLALTKEDSHSNYVNSFEQNS